MVLHMVSYSILQEMTNTIGGNAKGHGEEGFFGNFIHRRKDSNK